jgi:hypothetical protein
LRIPCAIVTELLETDLFGEKAVCREAERFRAAHCQSSSVDRIADFLMVVFIYLEVMVQ